MVKQSNLWQLPALGHLSRSNGPSVQLLLPYSNLVWSDHWRSFGWHLLGRFVLILDDHGQDLEQFAQRPHGNSSEELYQSQIQQSNLPILVWLLEHFDWSSHHHLAPIQLHFHFHSDAHGWHWISGSGDSLSLVSGLQCGHNLHCHFGSFDSKWELPIQIHCARSIGPFDL